MDTSAFKTWVFLTFLLYAGCFLPWDALYLRLAAYNSFKKTH